MNGDTRPTDNTLSSLTERARELQCLYEVEKLTRETIGDLDIFMDGLLKVIPIGWQYSESCGARLLFRNREWATAQPREDGDPVQRASIQIKGTIEGSIEVYYPPVIHDRYSAEEIFLPEEESLLEAIASLVGNSLSRRLQPDIESPSGQTTFQEEWEIELHLLKHINKPLHDSIIRKMLNLLCRLGVDEARSILRCIGMRLDCPVGFTQNDQNKPVEKISRSIVKNLNQRVSGIAKENLTGDVLTESLHRWIRDDKAAPLVRILENRHSSLSDIIRVLSQFNELALDLEALSPAVKQTLQSRMISRLLSEQSDFVSMAKPFITPDYFYDLLIRTLAPPNSFGKLGGKSAGLIIASRILQARKGTTENIRIPKTWFITSDGLLSFIHLNNLEEIYEQKYKSLEQIREEYHNNVQVFKNSRFPEELVKGLSLALDDLGDVPIIVRSSSLLEDRLGAVFSGKYKSLFLANRGTRYERLISLMDAVAEVYASTFGPDPLGYRRERNLIDFQEEMGIMIQEVVGRKVGKYYLPAFSGVAFSHNEFRWSPRIERQDGLVRMVPGLGTRAVDRLSQDYPKLLAPGKPELEVNVSNDEIARYAPSEIDVIDLEENTFKTVPIAELLKAVGREYPSIEKIVSVYREDRIIDQPLFQIDFEKDDTVVTFNGIIRSTTFTETIKDMLEELEEKIGTPVDIEFAHDGDSLYILQCRPQSYSAENVPSPIPRDIPEQDIFFSALRFVSNGIVPDITHIVYIDDEGYTSLSNRSDMEAIGRVVGRLNTLLPKKKFILLGPGRWGSRGDIRLGVKVAYCDINNTAMLIEIARRRGNYTPDLSFGTHFFQDLVESNIHYLPLYPDEGNTHWNELFLSRAENLLGELLPDAREHSGVVKVIDVAKEKHGQILRVLQNAELNKALAFFTDPEEPDGNNPPGLMEGTVRGDHWWKWRFEMAKTIAGKIDSRRFGVKAVYLIGSVKNASAGPESDIDLLIHLSSGSKPEKELEAWLEGWDQCLCEMNYNRTGYRLQTMLDVHYITDADIEAKTSYAVKIDAITDSAKRLL